MTLEKDKEDQSKYYLSYPKPTVLDIKWENHDINVVEWANVPNSTERRLGEKVVLRLIECLTPTVSFDIFITISHLFVCLPTLELTTFEQQVCSSAQMQYHWEKTAAKKKNVATLNSAHQAKKQCNFDSG